jgi:hypothetical protein
VVAGHQKVQNLDVDAFLDEDSGQITQGKGREWTLLQRVWCAQ